jgi:hypothetical protein
MNYKSVKHMTMKVQGMGLQVLLLVTLMVLGVACDKEDEPTPPAISGFSPATGGLPGSTATITGQNFGATPSENLVQFNGVTATTTAATSTQLTVTVPQATTGKITVTVNGMTATSAAEFIVLIPAPVVTSFSPATGRAGTAITITGQHFNKTVAENAVKFNGVTATVTQASETSLTVTVPDGTSAGKVTVTIGGQSATSTTDFQPIHTIYVAGHSYDSDNSNIYIAEYWKDGTLTSMSDGTVNSSIAAIDVVGPDVYLAGALGEKVDEDTETSYAAYWKNGTVVKLTNGTDYAELKAIDVVGNDVYAAGTDGSRGVYWKNGVPTYLSDGSTQIGIEGMFVSGSDIYVVGYESNSSGNAVGKYWKNGVAVEVGGESVILSSILVSGTDVYAAGYYNNDAYYWKNGVPHKMPNTIGEAVAWDMAIVGDDIYVVGRDEAKAICWKNDIRIDLEDGSSANAIFILGNDVYIAGEDRSFRAKYWKNGEVVNLTEEESGHSASALAIVVR